MSNVKDLRMSPEEQIIINKVIKYYNEKLAKHGANHSGVDWNSSESQQLRFQQLLNVIQADQPFSILNYGCGYGALLDYMNSQYPGLTHFTGFDISNEMIQKSKEQFGEIENSKWITSVPDDFEADYVISSGIFNVKLDTSDKIWTEYILNTIDKLHIHSRKGFAFNALTSYSDQEYMKDYLHYADPLHLFDYCKRKYSRNVTLLHDYDLYEFSVVVKK